MECNRIAWVGPGYYAPNKAYGYWIYVGEEGKEDWRVSPVIYFTTRDEFDRMIEREVNDERTGS